MRRLLLSFWTMLMGANAALAGGWVIGGGEVLQDAYNPWFIQNTSDVSYCVQIDPNAFHLPQNLAEMRVRQALDYWKDEFSRSVSMNVNGMPVQVATQSFHLVNCLAGADITFQLGWLTDSQKTQIGDPTHFVATTVRTYYDRVNLKGKGFIYVAADSGPLKPSSNQIAAMPWNLADGGLLYRVLVHELGHVFGLVDSASLPNSLQGTGMMSGAYPEYMLNKQWAARGAEDLRMPNYFKSNADGLMSIMVSCSGGQLQATKAAFYGINPTWKCLTIDYQPGKMTVLAAADDDGETNTYQMVGTAILDGAKSFRLENSILVWLPPEQIVFPNPEQNIYTWGPMIVYETVKGIYRSVDGKITRPVLVTMPLNETRGSVIGVMDGQLWP